MRSQTGATRSSRSAACSRTTRDRSQPSPPTSVSPACSCRSTGSTGPMRSTTRSGTSSSRASWARTSVSTRQGSTSASAPAGSRRWPTSRGGRPYAIPAGASDHPLGGLGFARWAEEVETQERELGVFFDTVVVCSVTGSTHAGMVAGFAKQERPRTVLGIDGSATVQQTREQVTRIAQRTAEAIDLGRELVDDEIVLLDEWHAGTYGIPDAKTLAAIRLCARLEGVLTDPVYEGKSMAALIDLVQSERIEPGSRVLYAHLGGQPALNAYAGAF